MKRLSKWSVCIVLLMALTMTASAALQDPRPAPQEPQAPAQQERQFQGSLVKVDPAAHMITAKGADEKEWQFSYTDKTEIVGGEQAQGLTGKAGSKLKITYMVDKGINQATRIEISE